MKYEVIPGRIWSQSIDGTVTIRSDQGGVWQLNGSAAAVWSSFQNPASIEQAAEALAASFEKYSKDDFLEVVVDTVQMLREYELLRPCMDCVVDTLDKSHFPAPEIAFDAGTVLAVGSDVACNCNLR